MNNTNPSIQAPNANALQVPPPASKGLLKVAIDTHADFDVWAAQFDGTAPKPPQKLPRHGLVRWLLDRRAEGWDVVTCYEAGPFGYGLHRLLAQSGIRNLVIRPRNWDDEDKRVRTDRSDTKSMLVALDRYMAGQKDAFTLIRVPTEEEERRRAPVRLLDSLQRNLRSVAQSGRGQALYFGIRLRGAWHAARQWEKLSPTLPEAVRLLLEPLRRLIAVIAEEIDKLRAQVRGRRDSGPQLPVGLGRDSAERMESEVMDWSRFRNRRGIGSFAGLTPGEASSGKRRDRGAITKRGSAALRWMAVQAAWRMLRYQPDYRGSRRFRERLSGTGKSASRKRQLLVALAREFLVDWWRIRTGQTTPEKLGLRMAQAD